MILLICKIILKQKVIKKQVFSNQFYFSIIEMMLLHLFLVKVLYMRYILLVKVNFISSENVFIVLVLVNYKITYRSNVYLHLKLFLKRQWKKTTTFRWDDIKKREGDIYKIFIVSCKSSPKTVLWKVFLSTAYRNNVIIIHTMTFLVCGLFCVCDTQLHTLLCIILHHPQAQSRGLPQTHFTIKRVKE